MNGTPGIQGPAPGRGPRSCRDHRPGLRTLLVPRLLSRGLTPAQTARTTGVPMPLVTLIADHEPDTPAPAAALTTRTASMPVPRRRPKNATPARLLFIAAITAGCAGSILWHEPLLPIVLVTAGSLAGNSLRDRLPAGRRHASRE